MIPTIPATTPAIHQQPADGQASFTQLFMHPTYQPPPCRFARQSTLEKAKGAMTVIVVASCGIGSIALAPHATQRTQHGLTA